MDYSPVAKYPTSSQELLIIYASYYAGLNI